MRRVSTAARGAAGHRSRSSAGAVGKHVAGIFATLGLPPSDNDNRRVLAALRFLGA